MNLQKLIIYLHCSKTKGSIDKNLNGLMVAKVIDVKVYSFIGLFIACYLHFLNNFEIFACVCLQIFPRGAI